MVKINGQQLRQIIGEELGRVVQRRAQLGRVTTEATGGDGEFERVDGTNWQHLEVGNHYDCKEGRRSVASVSVFVGWVEPDTRQMTDSEDPEQVNLLFSDVSDGMEWEAYWFEGTYCVGSSADPLYVKEED